MREKKRETDERESEEGKAVSFDGYTVTSFIKECGSSVCVRIYARSHTLKCSGV